MKSVFFRLVCVEEIRIFTILPGLFHSINFGIQLYNSNTTSTLKDSNHIHNTAKKQNSSTELSICKAFASISSYSSESSNQYHQTTITNQYSQTFANVYWALHLCLPIHTIQRSNASKATSTLLTQQHYHKLLQYLRHCAEGYYFTILMIIMVWRSF